MSIQFANQSTSNSGTFNPGVACLDFLEQDSQTQRAHSHAHTTSSSRRSSNRRQPWIDARKLSDEQKQQHIEAENRRKSRRSSVRAAWETAQDLFSKPPSQKSSRNTSRDGDEPPPEFVRAMPGDEEFRSSRLTVLSDRRRSLVHGLHHLHKHDSMMGSGTDRGVLSKYSGGRERDSKIPRKESYVRTSVPNALLPSNEADRKWARQVLRYYSSNADVAQCDVFTWHALERADDPVHLIIYHGEMIFLDQYGKNLPDQPSIADELEIIHQRGLMQPSYETFEVPLTRIPTREVDEEIAYHFRAILERNGSELLAFPTAVRVGWWLHNAPVYRVRYREAELWMTIDGRNMPNRPTIADQIMQLRETTDDAMRSESSGEISPGHATPQTNPGPETGQPIVGQDHRGLKSSPKRRGKFGRFLGWMGVR